MIRGFVVIHLVIVSRKYNLPWQFLWDAIRGQQDILYGEWQFKN